PRRRRPEWSTAIESFCGGCRSGAMTVAPAMLCARFESAAPRIMRAFSRQIRPGFCRQAVFGRRSAQIQMVAAEAGQANSLSKIGLRLFYVRHETTLSCAFGADLNLRTSPGEGRRNNLFSC